ncbi:MAG: replication initiation protein [Roseovarius sp.]|nr:replication initiation protein [Roseovarius sp.]MCY4317181.1 replication initiation protein [Roseovarius sp.]
MEIARHWTFTVDELRALMGVAGKRAYRDWRQFQKRVLKPALEQINDFGTVSVKMIAKRLGRSIHWVQFE